MANDNDLLRPDEAAKLLGVHPKTLSRYVNQGLLQARKTAGGHNRYRRQDLDWKKIRRRHRQKTTARLETE